MEEIAVACAPMQWQEFRAHIRHLPDAAVDRIHRAFVLGEHMHRGQLRKSGEPYFSHPIAVACMLIPFGADADTIIAALLHDTLEDTTFTLAEAARQFGPTVADLLDGVTKLCREDLRGKTNLTEQIETLRKTFRLMQHDVRIMVIKLVDRLHNMQTVRFLPEERRRAFIEETQDAYVKIADRLCMQDLRDQLEGLCMQHFQPELFARLTELRAENARRSTAVIRTMQNDIAAQNPLIGSHVSLEHEPRGWVRLAQQMETHGAAATGIPDVTVVFICPDIDTCYRTMGALHQLWRRETLSFQDYINAPRINGYRGLHTTVILSEGTRVRCKIRCQEMHAYARRGIAMLCFDRPDSAHGFLDALPWMRRISPLAEDTGDRSTDFWQSLQSDILGESMVIHGPGDETVQIPKHATALDGAFYLLNEAALCTRTILVNGYSVDFATPLKHADSLSIALDDVPRVDRTWLRWAHTGLATARIRAALQQHNEREKVAIGKELLQEVFTDRRRGFVEEIDATHLRQSAGTLDYATPEAAFAAIAEGHLTPLELHDAIFPVRQATDSALRCRFSCHFAHEDGAEAARRTVNILETSGASFLHLHTSSRADRHGTEIVADILMPQNADQKHLRSAFADAGAFDMLFVTSRSSAMAIVSIATLFAFWGLDPVIAFSLIHRYDLSAIDLSIVRFWSFVTLGALYLLWVRMHAPVRAARIPLRDPSLFVSAVLLIIVALSTYASLALTPPSHYTIPMTIAGLAVTMLSSRRRWQAIIACTFFLLGLLPIVDPNTWPVRGMAFTALAVLAFTAFSAVSERYKRHHHVAARTAQYVLALAVLCAIFILFALPFSTLFTLPAPVLARMALFSIFISGLPYFIYYFLLSHREIAFILRFSFLNIPSTLLWQTLLLGQPTTASLLAGMFVIVGALLSFIRPATSSSCPAR